ncbi:MAG: hypothetical protein R3F11_09655 [Verrucomicrobiales bacterium]
MSPRLTEFCRRLPRAIFAFALVVGFAAGGRAEDAVSLMAEDAWSFDNGREFPGAKGLLSAEAGSGKGAASLKLVADFRGGGGYVQAGRQIGGIDIDVLRFKVRTADTDELTLRLNDGSGQTHQIVIGIEPGSEWRQVSFPLDRFFAMRGTAEAVTSVKKFESWGGANDGSWHAPAKALYILVTNRGTDALRTVWLSEIEVVPRPMPVKGAEVAKEVDLSEIIDGAHDWGFSSGQEFPGATGSLGVAEDAGQPCLKLDGDFTGGGAYVAAIRNLGGIAAQETQAFRLRYKTPDAASVGIQIVDASGQTHQRRDYPLAADGAWHDLELDPAKIAGGEHWGGANDGKWHGPAKQFVLSLTNRSDAADKAASLWLTGVRAVSLVPVFARDAAFEDGFEQPDLRWAVQGGAKLSGDAAGGAQSLELARTVNETAQPCEAISPAFAAAPGSWRIGVALKAALYSPDNSYHGAAVLECLDAGGKIAERMTVAEVFGRRGWERFEKIVELPEGTAAARIALRLNKTYGSFFADEVTAAFLAPAALQDDRIERVLFSTEALGNLLLPGDRRKIGIEVRARKPLRADQRSVACVVRDYWGAEHSEPMAVALGDPQKVDGGLLYRGDLDLGGAPLDVGRYYEVHAAIPQEGEPFRQYTSLAILPEAVTRQYKPEEVPFTCRNWDNRIGEYIRLTDRLGIRICGLWGGWSPKPPYEPQAPGLDLVKELGMGWLTTTPAATIERGSDEYSDEALRLGAKNFVEKFGGDRPLIINLGNEPHGTGEQVMKNVAAYKTIYQAVKAADPDLPVVATSVEPNEEYFKAGYGKWCDAYDFHIYEHYENVRRTIGEYRELAEKYGVEKPIWSTELGLNSQGLPRHRVAVELIKKFATFFAAGGENVSWFGLLYPDADGKSFGSSGDSHNVFDCRYNRYCPLAAVALLPGGHRDRLKLAAERDCAGGARFIPRPRRSLPAGAVAMAIPPTPSSRCRVSARSAPSTSMASGARASMRRRKASR